MSFWLYILYEFSKLLTSHQWNFEILLHIPDLIFLLYIFNVLSTCNLAEMIKNRPNKYYLYSIKHLAEHSLLRVYNRSFRSVFFTRRRETRKRMPKAWTPVNCTRIYTRRHAYVYGAPNAPDKITGLDLLSACFDAIHCYFHAWLAALRWLHKITHPSRTPQKPRIRLISQTRCVIKCTLRYKLRYKNRPWNV